MLWKFDQHKIWHWNCRWWVEELLDGYLVKLLILLPQLELQGSIVAIKWAWLESYEHGECGEVESGEEENWGSVKGY